MFRVLTLGLHIVIFSNNVYLFWKLLSPLQIYTYEGYIGYEEMPGEQKTLLTLQKNCELKLSEERIKAYIMVLN